MQPIVVGAQLRGHAFIGWDYVFVDRSLIEVVRYNLLRRVDEVVTTEVVSKYLDSAARTDRRLDIVEEVVQATTTEDSVSTCSTRFRDIREVKEHFLRAAL